VVGGSNGAVEVYFRLQRSGISSTDGYEMIRTRSHESQPGAVIGIDVAQRQKAIATLDDQAGNVWVRHSTSDRTLFKLNRESEPATPAAMMLMPRMNGVLLVDDQGAVDSWRFYFPHAASTFQTIFGKVWYEGYRADLYLAVVVGHRRVRAQVFSCAADFRHDQGDLLRHDVRGADCSDGRDLYLRIRPSPRPRDRQAGDGDDGIAADRGARFHAALILAPLVESWIAAVLLGFIALPLGLMIAAAFAWQTLPPAWGSELKAFRSLLDVRRDRDFGG
jgi:phosphate transport system permease protein